MTKTLKLGVAALGVAATLAAGAAGAAYAATETFTANVAFAAPLTLTKVADPNFGTLAALTAADYTLDTAGAVTSANGGEQISATNAQAGELLISGSETQAINIVAGNYVVENGVTPSNATCTYDGSDQDAADCTFNGAGAPGVAGKTLLVGLDINVDGTQNDGAVATPTFDVSVVYN